MEGVVHSFLSPTRILVSPKIPTRRLTANSPGHLQKAILSPHHISSSSSTSAFNFCRTPSIPVRFPSLYLFATSEVGESTETSEWAMQGFYTLRKDVESTSQRVEEIRASAGLQQLEADLADLERAAADSSLWDDRTKAQQTLVALTDVKDKLKLLNEFRSQVEDAETIVKLTEEMDSTDTAFLEEAANIIKELNKALDRFELTQLLSGPYDKEGAVISITAGAGGTDAQDWADMLLRMYVRWGEKQQYKTRVVEKSMGEEAGIKSATIELEGRYAYGYKMRMKASAGFVSASALGMAFGPALACLFQTKFKIFKITFNQETLPGWSMAFAWLVYLLWLWIAFKEPPNDDKDNVEQQEANTGLENGRLENGFTEPLLLSSGEKQEDEDEDQECEPSEEAEEDIHKPVTSIVSAYKLLTPSVKAQLFIYFMLKYAMEILLAESSVITTYYFIWSTTNVAIFLACLGLTVLPVNIFVGSYISNIFEERQVLLGSEIMVCLGILLSFQIIVPYSVTQYIGSALITFVFAEVIEGVNLSLLSRVMSSRLSRGTFNGGLLSTEAGTIARVIADGTVTLAGYWGMSKLLNVTLLPSLFICIFSIIATIFTYNSLY